MVHAILGVGPHCMIFGGRSDAQDLMDQESTISGMD
jgi:hypothetical protein